MTESQDRLEVQVTLGDRGYPISITSNELSALPEYLDRWREARGSPARAGQVLVITDSNVARLYLQVVCERLSATGWQCDHIVVPAGEQSKSLSCASLLYDRLVELKAARNMLVVALGGGVIGDLAGFVAATYARSIPFVQVPTTLLAQVDSSVGGKVGINHPRAKNLIGAFYQPRGVLIDTAVLDTLPARDYRSGLAEVIKYGVILDAEFFEYLEQHVPELNTRDPEVLRQVIAGCCRLKADVVEQDEYERTGIRATLNYGHTFGHAFEALGEYGTLQHGEAVAIGMLYASRLAERLGRIPAEMTTRQRNLIEAVGLPSELPAGLSPAVDDIIDRMRLDKKSVSGRLRFVLPTRMGHVETVADIPEEIVRAVLTDRG